MDVATVAQLCYVIKKECLTPHSFFNSLLRPPLPYTRTITLSPYITYDEVQSCNVASMF